MTHYWKIQRKKRRCRRLSAQRFNEPATRQKLISDRSDETVLASDVRADMLTLRLINILSKSQLMATQHA